MPIANCRAASPTRTPGDIDSERHRRRRDRREQRYRRSHRAPARRPRRLRRAPGPPPRPPAPAPCVALWPPRRDPLQALAAEIEQADGTALVVEADITDRSQAEAAMQ